MKKVSFFPNWLSKVKKIFSWNRTRAAPKNTKTPRRLRGADEKILLKRFFRFALRVPLGMTWSETRFLTSFEMT